jgi:ribose transport system permease protein
MNATPVRPDVASPDWSGWLARTPQAIVVVAALIWMARTPNFFTARTLGSVLELVGIIGVLAMGQVFCLIGGGFDLSQGANLALSAAVTAGLARAGWHPAVAAGAALAVGMLLGALNGGFVAALRINPFVTTLSTLLIYRGTAYVLLGGERISGVSAFDALNQGLTLGPRLIVPWRSLIFPLIAAPLAWLTLRQTIFGQYVYAIGGNEEATRLAGVRTARVKAATFALSGLAAGAGAILLLAWVHVAKPDTGSAYEMDSLAACVVGGVSLQGGAGGAPGAAAGALLLEALRTRITMGDLPDEYRTIITGGVILLFAAADAMARRPGRR